MTDDFQRGEDLALALIPALLAHLEDVQRKDRFWCAIFIVLAVLATSDLEEDASELLHAAVSVGVGDPGFGLEDSSESNEGCES